MTTAVGEATSDEDPRGDLRWGTIPRLVSDAAARFADREAVVDGGLRITFADLAARADAMAAGLMASTLAPGDRVCVWAPNSLDWIVAALGTTVAGGILVPLNTRFKGSEAAHVIRTSGARVLCTVGGFLGTDYPELLAGEDLGALESVVVMGGGTSAPASARASIPASASTVEAAGGPLPVTPLADVVARGASVPAAEVRRRAEAVRPGDVCDLVFTSGTTGAPKGAMATHAQTVRTFATWASVVGLEAGDRYLIVNPFFHTFGYKAGVLTSLMAGATIIPEAVFDADRVLARISDERVSVLPGPPTLYQSLLDHPHRRERDLTTLRLGVTGASTVPVELVVAMRSELGFDTVLTAYGLTESCGIVTMCRRGDPPEIVARTSGRAIPGVEVRIVGPDGAEAERSTPGEVLVRGYNVMPGYFGDPVASAEAVDGDGWLHTGDIGVMDAQGNVAITDRLKDMFVVGGFNAYPAEIEAMLRTHPDVGQVAVVGMPDPRMGEVGCAFVVPIAGVDPGLLPERLIAWSRQHMANYKVPRSVVVVDGLPTNAAGKVLKRELRAQVGRTG